MFKQSAEIHLMMLQADPGSREPEGELLLTQSHLRLLGQVPGRK